MSNRDVPQDDRGSELIHCRLPIADLLIAELLVA
jgi:hypothetical protein